MMKKLYDYPVEYVPSPTGNFMIAKRAKPAAAKPKAPARPAAASPAAPKPFSFADRMRSILDSPEARERPRQAFRMALETSASPAEARRVLASLPTDEARGFAHGQALFPAAGVQLTPEAARAAAIMALPEAEGREKPALELAMGTRLPLEQVQAVLAQMPIVKAERIPTIAERAAEMEGQEFGASTQGPRMGKNGAVDQMWADVIARTNAQQQPDKKGFSK